MSNAKLEHLIRDASSGGFAALRELLRFLRKEKVKYLLQGLKRHVCDIYLYQYHQGWCNSRFTALLTCLEKPMNLPEMSPPLILALGGGTKNKTHFLKKDRH